MQRLKSWALSLLVIAILLIFAAGAIRSLIWAFHLISSVPKELGAALVTGATTVCVATATVMVGRYYERRKELDALYRDKKTQMYDEFLKKFLEQFIDSEVAQDESNQKELVQFIGEFTRKLILWSGPEVIEAFVAWKDHLAKGEANAHTIFLTEAFLISIRNDLRNSNRGLSRGFFAKLFLKEGALFLKMAAENPNVTLAELAKVEKALHAANTANSIQPRS